MPEIIQNILKYKMLCKLDGIMVQFNLQERHKKATVQLTAIKTKSTIMPHALAANQNAETAQINALAHISVFCDTG